MANLDADAIERIGRDLEMLVRLQISANQGDKSQSEMIRELKAMGLSSADTARYLGTTVKIVGTIAARGRVKGVRGSGRIK